MLNKVKQSFLVLYAWIECGMTPRPPPPPGKKDKKSIFSGTLFYSEIKFWSRLSNVSYLHKELFNESI